MKEKKLIPKRRFKEFENDEAWEQRKIKDMFKVTRGHVLAATKTSREKTDSTPYPVYSSQTADQGLMGYYNEYLYSDAITWTTDGANAGTVNYRKGQFYCTNVCGVLISEEGYANKMVSEALNKVAWKHVSKVGNPKLMNNVMSDIAISIPKNMKEQKEIANFFGNLDNLITLHQRKLKKLKETKSAYLSEMFPKEGEKYPKRRFAGFTDPWEQRKLGELAQYRRGSFPQPYGREEWYDGDGAMPFVQVVDVTDQLALALKTKQKISRLAQPMSIFVPKGSVIVTLQGSIGRVAITQYDCFVDRTLLIFERYNKPINEVFWAYTIQMKFDVEKEKAPGGTIKTITKEALTNFIVSLPSLEEQEKIGTFFNNLDKLITLHKRKLEKLENLKKAYLNEMFV